MSGQHSSPIGCVARLDVPDALVPVVVLLVVVLGIAAPILWSVVA